MTDPLTKTLTRNQHLPLERTHSLPAKAGKEQVWAILRGLGRRWKQVVGFGILAAAAIGASVWFLLPPPVPSASAKLYMPQKPPTALFDHPDPPLERQTQVELIKSRLVLNAAIRPPEINSLSVLQAQQDPLDWLSNKLKVEFQGPEIIRLSLSCADAEQARLLVDAVKDSYLNHIVLRTKREREARLQMLTKMESDQKNILTRKRDAMNGLAKAGSDTAKIQFEKRIIEDQMQAARNQLVRARLELQSGRLKEGIYAADAPGEVSEDALNQYVELDARVVPSAQNLKKLEADFEEVRSRAADPKAQLVLDKAAELAIKQKEHDALRLKLRDSIRGQVQAQSKAERAAKHLQIRQENFILDQQVKQLEAELLTYSKSLIEHQDHTQQLDPYRFEIKQAEDLLVSIQKMITTLKIEDEAPARVWELEKAVIAMVDAEKRKVLFSVGGAMIGLVVVLVAVGLVEFWQRRVDSPHALSHGVGLRILGTVPRPVKHSPRWWWMDSAADSYRLQVHSEAISCARAMLLHGDVLSPHRIFLITSPVSGEGKSTLTMQLAASVAQSGRQTLLVDADLRKPSLHEWLGVSAEAPGLCEVLRGEASIFDVVQQTQVPGLLLIPAGRWTSQTGKALVSAHVGQLFGVFRDQFEFVLVDSSPALPVADALIIGRHTDGVILSLLQGVSRVPQATETCDRFTAIGVQVLGAFVNGTTAEGYGYGKYYRDSDKTPSSVEAK